MAMMRGFRRPDLSERRLSRVQARILIRLHHAHRVPCNFFALMANWEEKRTQREELAEVERKRKSQHLLAHGEQRGLLSTSSFLFFLNPVRPHSTKTTTTASSSSTAAPSRRPPLSGAAVRAREAVPSPPLEAPRPAPLTMLTGGAPPPAMPPRPPRLGRSLRRTSSASSPPPQPPRPAPGPACFPRCRSSSPTNCRRSPTR